MPCRASQNFDQACKKSVGGVNKIYIANLDEMTITLNATPGPLLNAVDLITPIGATFFYQFTPIPTTGSGTADAQGVGGGGAVNYLATVTAQLADLKQETINGYDDLIGARIIAAVESREVDDAGFTKWFLFGLGGGLLATTATAQTGQADADLSGFTFAFTGTLQTPPAQIVWGGDNANTAIELAALLLP